MRYHDPKWSFSGREWLAFALLCENDPGIHDARIKFGQSVDNLVAIAADRAHVRGKLLPMKPFAEIDAASSEYIVQQNSFITDLLAMVVQHRSLTREFGEIVGGKLHRLGIIHPNHELSGGLSAHE